MLVLGFDWDIHNQSKIEKRSGMTIKLIESFFRQEDLWVGPDVKHSAIEQRYLALGLGKNKPMFVIFTFREKRERV